jgi:hypothetical protein
MKDAFLTYSAISENSLSSLIPLSDALKKLKSKLKKGAELRKAAYAFSCYVQNLRALPNEVTLTEQLSLLFPIRTFLPMIPTRFPGIGTRDIWVLVVMAYYHAIQVATALKYPAIASLLFAIKRTEVILRIHNELYSINTRTSDVRKMWELEKAVAMMRLPVLYVVHYRFRYCILKE